MKKLLIIALFPLIFQSVYGQKYLLGIKNGTHLEYLFDLHGQKRTIDIVTKMPSDSLIMEWNLRGIKGSYIILSEALEKGNQMSIKQIVPFQSVILKTNETFCMISRSAFHDLLKNHRFVYNNTTYVLNDNGQDNSNQLNGNTLDVLHVTAQIDETEMWILNNPDFPIISKIIKNPLGINFKLISISYD